MSGERGDDGCWVPFYGSTPGKRRVEAGHDWRLISEGPAEVEIRHQPGAPGYGYANGKGATRRWYCTRCRRLETTTEEDV